VLLLGIVAVFSLLWLSEIVPSMLAGTVPDALAEAGLPTNPVHVLDLAVFLPAAGLAGVLLVRRRAWGYVLAPVMLVAMVLLGLGIVSLMATLAARGLSAAPEVGAAFAVLAVVGLVVVVRFLRAIDRNADLQQVLRPRRGVDMSRSAATMRLQSWTGRPGSILRPPPNPVPAVTRRRSRGRDHVRCQGEGQSGGVAAAGLGRAVHAGGCAARRDLVGATPGGTERAHASHAAEPSHGRDPFSDADVLFPATYPELDSSSSPVERGIWSGRGASRRRVLRWYWGVAVRRGGVSTMLNSSAEASTLRGEPLCARG
jgi:hypothetical protein